MLAPLAGELEAPHVTRFHGFRHTCASLLFERGANVKQVQPWLGHKEPTVTLNTYIHLLGEDMGEALSLDAELAGVGTPLGTQPPLDPPSPEGAEAPDSGTAASPN